MKIFLKENNPCTGIINCLYFSNAIVAEREKVIKKYISYTQSTERKIEENSV